MAGYSGTPLPRKLGIKDGDRIAVLGAPEGWQVGIDLGEAQATVRTALGKQPLDLVILFVRTRAELAAAWKRTTAALTPAGALWVAWPKKSARDIVDRGTLRGSPTPPAMVRARRSRAAHHAIPSDMTEDFVREVALPAGWVDNKVCAIDEVWSGLRCVLRLENRPVAKPKAKAKPGRG
jgi:hypothetical protein